jgi:hypothetical protein
MRFETTEVLERVAANHRARRELVWIDAMSRGDAEMRRDLERSDPDLEERMRPYLEMLRPVELKTPKRRREAFAKLWSICYERHAAAVIGERPGDGASKPRLVNPGA